MKLLCLFILLINISFFLWEYRQGAPEVYQPQRVVERANNRQGKQQIFLLAELPPINNYAMQRAATISMSEIATPLVARIHDVDANEHRHTVEKNGFLKEHSTALQHTDALSTYLARQFIPSWDERHDLAVSLPNKPIEHQRFNVSHSANVAVLLAMEPSFEHNIVALPLSGRTPVPITYQQSLDFIGSPTPKNAAVMQNKACYALHKSRYKKEMQSLFSHDSRYQLKFIDQEQEFISSYLVLTNVADSLQDAKAEVNAIKQQGIDELWLFRQGEFKWRISLGLFSTKAKAVKASKNYSRNITQALTIVPSVRKKQTTLVIVTAAEAFMGDFESKFSVFIEQKISCSENDS